MDKYEVYIVDTLFYVFVPVCFIRVGDLVLTEEEVLMERKKFVAGLLIVLSLSLSVAFAVRIEAEGAKSPPGHVSPIATSSYIVFSDGIYVYAKNGKTGLVDYSGRDASEVIQASINALGPSGGSVLIREGTYVISKTIKVPGDVTLSGVGFATKLVLEDYADEEVIENMHADAYVDSNIVINDLQIDGNGGRQTPGEQVSPIFLSRVSRSRVEGCWIHNVASGSTNAGIYALFGRFLIIRGNVVYDNLYAAIFLALGVNAIVSNNQLYNSHRGVYLANHRYGIVEGNQIISCDEGVRMYVTASNNTIQGNTIKNSIEEGIIITHVGCKNNFLHGNQLIANTVQILDLGVGTLIKGNPGYRTENEGVATAANRTYIAHGLVAAPSLVLLTPTDKRTVACTFRNSTHIQIGLWYVNGNAVTTPEDVYWHAEI